jgi:hypothetical protein
MLNENRDNNNGVGFTIYNDLDETNNSNLYLYNYYNHNKIGLLTPLKKINLDNISIVVDNIKLKQDLSTILYEDNQTKNTRNDLFEIFDLERDIADASTFDNYILNNEDLSNKKNWIKKLTYNGIGFFGISYFNNLTSNIQVIQNNSDIDTIYNIKLKPDNYPFELSAVATNNNYNGFWFKIDTGTIGNLCLGYKETFNDYNIYIWNENKDTFMTGIKYYNNNEQQINHSLFFKGNFYKSNYLYSIMYKINEVDNVLNDPEISAGFGYENDNIAKLQFNFEIDNTEEIILSKNILLNSTISKADINLDYKDSNKKNDTQTYLISDFSIHT